MLRKKTAKLSTLFLSLALVGSLLSGCGSSSTTPAASKGPTGPQIIKYNLGAEPKSIDPGLNDAVDGATVIVNAFEGLTNLDDKEKPIAGVAEKWDVSADGLHYTFHLRKNAVWSDGKAVKAADFEYAWKRALDPATASNYAYQLYYLKNGQGYNESSLPADQKTAGVAPATKDQVGVKAVDDTTLQVDLEYPTAYFLSLMAFPTYMPLRQDVLEKNPKDWTTNPATYVTNGPLVMKEWKPKDKMVFVKNDKYWNKATTKIAEVDYSFLDQETSYMSAFQTGQLDFIEAPPTQQIPQLLKDGTAKIFPYLGTYYLELNVSTKAASSVDKAALKALSDVRVRKALNLAIDRQALIDNITKGQQVPAAAMVPNGIPDATGKDFRNKDYFNPKGDVAQAKQLLSDAGYPDGKGFPKLVYLYNTSQGHQQIAQAIQDMWKKNLGIDVELANQEWKVFQQTRIDKNFEVARAGWIADYEDPMTFLDMWTTGSGNNDAGYANPQYDAKIKAAKAENNATKRMALLHEAEDMLMTDLPIVPVYFYTNICCVKPYVKDVHKSPLGFVYFAHAYIDKSATK